MIDPLASAGLADVTFIALACQYIQPPQQQPEPIELSAAFLRLTDGACSRIEAHASLIRPPQHVAISAAELSSIGIERVSLVSAPTAPQVLSQLDGRLNTPTYVLLSYNARTLARVLYQYREHCPRLSLTHLINIHQLARRMLPELAGHHLEAVLQHLGLPARIKPHRAISDLEAEIGVFEYLAQLADSAWDSRALRHLRQMAEITPQAAVPVQQAMF